jgi:Domain of unknown function (DUF4185)
MRTQVCLLVASLLALAACGLDSNAEMVAAASGDPLGTGAGLDDSAPEMTWVSTAHIGQFTGAAPNAYASSLDMIGTDLGVSFRRGDKLYFLFGDSWTPLWFLNGNQDLDSIGWTSAARPNGVPKLNWFTRPNSQQFLAFGLPGYKPLRLMSVPVEGIAIGDRNYIFFYNSTGKRGESSPPVRSILAHSVGEAFGNLQIDHEVTSAKFQSISVVEDEEDVIWIYGAGPYRNSPVYLARVPASTLTDRNSWTYYSDGGSFVAGEENAQPLVDENCVGELSVRKHETEPLYFMAYNCSAKNPDGTEQSPHYVALRTARRPEGPWSEPLTILTAAEGYGDYIHGQEPPDDGLGESHLTGRADAPGDIYGPYLIPAWFSEPEPGRHEIVYTLSSWNPYQVHLMRTVLAER